MIAGMVTDLDRLLDFAERSRLPEGGFGYLGADGTVLADRPQETWIVARMTHVFGLAQLRPIARELGTAREIENSQALARHVLTVVLPQVNWTRLRSSRSGVRRRTRK